MTIDKDGLAAALVAFSPDPDVRAIYTPYISAAITAYLSALPNTGDGLAARLRQVPRHEGHSYPVEGAIRVVPYGNMLNDAADAIASLTARAQAAEASLASAREDALEEAAVAANATEDVVLAVEAIRALKGVPQ